MPSDTSPESKQIQGGLELLYEDVYTSDTNKIELICKLLGLKDSDGNNIRANEQLPLSREFNGCNKSVIDRMRHRCQIHDVPLIQCSLSYLNNLWNRCKTANETDTRVFDTNICPNLIKNDDNYALEFIRRYLNMTTAERNAVFNNDQYLKQAWESEYILKKVPGTKAKFLRDYQFSEEDSDYESKFFDELDVMQNCVLYDYTNPRHPKDYEKLKQFYINSGLYNELGEEGQERLDTYATKTGAHDGKFVNRFCDYGVPRPPGFYEYENPLIIPDSKTILDSVGEVVIDDDQKRFSAYSGVYKCPPGTTIDRDDVSDFGLGPYIDFEDPMYENKDCDGVQCVAGGTKMECLLQSVYHPDHTIDKQLSEDESQCYNHDDSSDPDNSSLCPGPANCSGCTPPPGNERAFWNSQNCKIRPANPNNIYGHSCEDDYAACVKVESPDELKKLRNQYRGQLKRDNNPENNCVCLGGDCSIITGCSSDEPIINTNLTYPDLKPHNFLTDDMIKDRENLFNTLENPTEPFYRCMRCGLRELRPHLEVLILD